MSLKAGVPVFVAGHRGMVGSAIVRALQAAGHRDLLLAGRGELDLLDSRAVDAYFDTQQPAYVFLAAARVGGIHANNSRPADFIFENLAIQNNVIDAAFRHGVHGLLFLGSSCIYPRAAEQPMVEEALLSGPLEPTNEAYAIAKIAGMRMCVAYNRQHGTDFRALMPTNLYGPGDMFDPADSHVIPGLLRRFHEARVAKAEVVEVWGSGKPLREFLHVDDLARACLFAAELDAPAWQLAAQPGHLNVGSGSELSIGELAKLVAEVVGYTGKIHFNPEYPDGTPRKLLDSSRIQALGWRPQTNLREGLAETYRWFVEAGGQARLVSS